jgi:hypothetical protein
MFRRPTRARRDGPPRVERPEAEAERDHVRQPDNGTAGEELSGRQVGGCGGRSTSETRLADSWAACSAVHMGSRPVSRSPGASDARSGRAVGHLRDLLLLGFDEGAEDARSSAMFWGGDAGGLGIAPPRRVAPSRRGSPYPHCSGLWLVTPTAGAAPGLVLVRRQFARMGQRAGMSPETSHFDG